MANLQKNLKQKNIKLFFSIGFWVLALLLVFLTIYANQIFGENSLLSQVFDNQDNGFELLGKWIMEQLPVVIRSLIWIIIIYGTSRLIRFVFSKTLMTSKKGRTASKLIDSFFKYLTALIVIIIVLLIFGVDPIALFASVGILGLIIGLGAQSLISDIISGLFIVFENEYEVGDIIVIDGFRGNVDSIGIRTTQLVDAGGNKKIVNNSQIVTVVNLSYADSVISIEFAVPYEDFDRFEELFKQNETALISQFPKLSFGPKYVGPISLDSDGIVVKIIGKVIEEERFQSERDLRRALVLLLNENHIDIPYETYVIKSEQ